MGRILCIGDSNTYGYDPHFYFGDCYGLVCFKMPVGMSLLLRQLNNPKECRINNLILCRFCCAAAKTWQIITSAIPTFQKDLRLPESVKLDSSLNLNWQLCSIAWQHLCNNSFQGPNGRKKSSPVPNGYWTVCYFYSQKT